MMSCAAPSIVGFARTPTRRIMTSATSTVPKGAPASTAKGGEGWTQRVLTLSPKQRGIFIWTDSLRRNVPEISSCQAGVLNLFLRSTTAALSVNENADPDVRTDLENALDRIVPGTESLDAVARSSFVGVSMDVPVQGGKLAFGTWQGLYLCEWGDGSAPIEVVATLVDNSADVKCTRNVTVKAPARGCHLVQDDVDDALAPARGRLSGTKPGLAHLLIRHTSASLTMNENADPTVRGDMEAALNRIVPERWHRDLFAHVEEGPDDMTAHVKSTLFGSSLTVPVDANGRMRTGTWQGVYLCEHRNIGGMGVGHAREIATAMLDGSGAANTAGQGTVTLTAPGRGCHDFTADIAAAAEGIGMGSKVRTGWLNLFCQHTSASLTVSERSIGSGAGDRLERALNDTVPESWNDEFFVHTYEGPDDMPGHVKASIMGPSITVPIVNGALGLGLRQGLFLCEHRNTGGFGCNLNRKVVLTLQGVDR